MGVVLALASAVFYGVSDYIGARASRRTSAAAITCVSEAVNLLVLLIVLPLVEPEGPTWRAVYGGWMAGLFGVTAVFGLYYALSRGSMSVVAPITAVVTAVLPVLVGVALGERPAPLAYFGIVLAIFAVALIGGVTGLSHSKVATSMIVLALLVGAGFGMMFVVYHQVGEAAGLWPLLFSRTLGFPLMLLFVLIERRRGTLGPISASRLLPGVTVGLLIVAANVAYLIASHQTLLSLVAVIVAMYPATTVALAVALDHEPVHRAQVFGMGLATVAVALIALS